MKNLNKILKSLIIKDNCLFCNTTLNGVEAVCNLDTVVNIEKSDSCLVLVDKYSTYNKIVYDEEEDEIYVEIEPMCD